MEETKQATNLRPIVRQILAQRGYSSDAEIEAFLKPDYEKDLHDPFQMRDMHLAVDRIVAAINNKETIVIYGDYDIDGLTATTLLCDFLAGIGAKVSGYIPDRFEEGYGINQQALKKLQKDGAQLVISVDCGITSVAEAEWARQNGLDLVITDHHAVPDVIPEAIAVINPKRPDDDYPFKDLAGVGVAFKLAQALQKQLGRPALGQEKWLLDLVALGTICDVVNLVDENRALVYYGLKVMTKTRRVGLISLAEVAGVVPAQIASYHVGFLLGPRLNAAGRLEHAKQALALLMSTDENEAARAANDLNRLNQERRDRQSAILAEAMIDAEIYSQDPVLVLARPDWDQGIIGIVASKLMERHHKPVIMLQILGDTAKASGRSTASFNLIESLRKLPDEYFIKLGGHHFAAGFTAPTERIDDIRSGLVELASGIEAELDRPADSAQESFQGLDLELISQLEQLEPFGNGNPKPVLSVPQAKIVQARRIGKDGQHLKLVLADGGGDTMTALGFGMAEQHPNLAPGQLIDVSFQLVSNDFLGYPEPEIVLSAIRTK